MSAKKPSPGALKAEDPIVEEAKFLVTVPSVDFNSLLNTLGTGMEEARTSDFLIPRLTILQALSPQLNRKKPEYIATAKAGDICDTSLGTVHETLLFLPAQYQKLYLEWAPRQSGKGLVRAHKDVAILDETEPNEKGQPILPNGNSIAETAQFLGFILGEHGPRPAFLAFSSTQLKKAKKWLTIARDFRLPDGQAAPLYFWCYKLGVAEEANNEGDWFGWTITPYKNFHDITREYTHAAHLLPAIAGLRQSYKDNKVRLADDGPAAADHEERM